LQKRKVLSLERQSEWATDDESGESMELIEEMPLKGLGAWLTERSRELIPETRGSMLEGTIVEKMMWMDKRV